MDEPASMLMVEFVEDHRLDEKATRLAGRPIMKTRELCRIRSSKDIRMDKAFPAHDVARTDKQTGRTYTYADIYSREYERFQQSRAAIGDGTPIELASFLTSSRKAEMQAMNIRTIDALAGMGPKEADALGPDGPGIVKQAKSYISDTGTKADARRLAGENQGLRDRIEHLEAELDRAQREIAAIRGNESVAA